jgi:diaminopimelate decarboxylase
MTTADLIRDLFPESDTEIRIGGIRGRELAREFGTPLFVYDESILRRRWNLLRHTYPARFDISYSVKANPNPELINFFLAQGTSLEIASAGELIAAKAAGCHPSNILFAGPGKTSAELELAIAAGIREIHAESLNELERINDIGRRLNKIIAVALRINPGADAAGGAMRMGGKATPFGIDEESIDQVLDRASDLSFLHLCGIHLFAGTQILDAEVLLKQYRKGLEIARHVAERLGALATVDFGGGLGVPYFAGDEPLNMERLRCGLLQIEQEAAGTPSLASTRFMIEPGRFLVAEAGVYLASVVDVKVSRGKTFVILDGGMNHHLAASGNLGQMLKRNFPVCNASRLNLAEEQTIDVVGPLCTPLDILARSLASPSSRVGDIFAVLLAGAYARTASPLGFLSHPTPPEVLVSDGEPRLIRRRGDFSDNIRDVVFVDSLATFGQRV